ncbi:MAG TPA: DUF294 nucleotidyltransferase-like domain-containing protein [Devosiaceae bacterium]|nr:DUF294 nucleotidyltransferase-like domain-containing protein [Devosiaceae bacterium]
MSFPVTPDRLSAVPLASLPAIVLDTETTGLDVGRDRVIEIGAVRLAAAADDKEAEFAQLVQPGVTIASAATAIHGLTDADVADAPGFAEALAALVEWSGPAIVIGFSVGFDLAILQAEHERAGLAWRAPRSLDVRHLLQLCGPQLPEMSLELAANWLGIEVVGRHRALGDARLTAAVFEALVPKLRARGITTLAQAERASRGLGAQVEQEARAGWHVAEGAGRPSGRIAEYARIDSFPYRHRVGDLMRSPPLVIAGEARLKDVLKVMIAEKVSSVFLTPDSTGGADSAYGIVTERDVLRAIESQGADALEQRAGTIGQRPLVTVDADEYAYRALARMAGKGFRHLGVVGAGGALVGALSARDLLRQRADDAIALGDGIEAAASPVELGRVWSELTAVARALAHEDVDSRDIAAIISRELRALTRRACEMAESELGAAGRGPAPGAYAVLVLGSGGRGESLLAMDQDNAIVYADIGDAAEPDRWFEALGVRMCEILDAAGVAMCKGGVMASNSKWRADLTGWRRTIGRWITRSRPEDILNCDIFFDAAAACGDIALADELLTEARAAAAGAGDFLKLLSLKAADFRVPVGAFGRLRREAGRVDLKAGGIMPIFSAARVVALRHNIAVRSTPERLEAVREAGIVPADTVNNLIEAHAILLGLILRQQLRDIDGGLALSNKVAPDELSSAERRQLGWALDQIPSVADLLGVPLIR